MSSPKQLPNSDSKEPARQPYKAMTLLLFGLLVLWITSIAVGTVAFGEVKDWRKPLLVVTPMAIFLLLWGVLLLRRVGK